MNTRSRSEPANIDIQVMIVGPGLKTEGGITEVIRRIFQQLKSHPSVGVNWVAAHRSGNIFQKIGQALAGLSIAIYRMPSTNLVHIHSAAYVSFFRKTVFFGLAKLFRRPVIWHLHTPNEDFVGFFGKKNLVGWYARFILRRCDRIVVLSDSWRTLAASVLPEESVVVIYNPTPANVVVDRSKRSGGEVRILYLAHLIQRKGYPLLIQAFADAHKEYPDCRLVFAGSGEIAEAKQQCAELEIQPNVDFLGWVGESVRERELQSASIFVLPSYQEGLPMGILEAMAYELAVISTPVGGIADVIRHGENGRLVQPGDAKALAVELIYLLRHADARDQLGQAARASVAGFGPEAIAQQWLDLYASVLPTAVTEVKS